MVWAGISYGQRTQLHFIDGNLNAQKFREEIPRPRVVPFIPRHNLMFQRDNAQQGSVHNSWKVNIPSFSIACIFRRHPLSMFRMLWIDMYNRVCQFPPISSNFAQPLKRSGTTFHRPQSAFKVSVTDRCISVFPAM